MGNEKTELKKEERDKINKSTVMVCHVCGDWKSLRKVMKNVYICERHYNEGRGLK